MKAIILKSGVVTGLFLLLAVVGNAQISQRYRAEIPFDFQARNTSYVAGTFQLGQMTSGGIVLTERTTGKAKVLSAGGTGGDQSSGHGKLIFNKINGVYTLAEVHTPTFGLKMSPPKNLKRSHRVSMNDTPKTETVVVLLTN